MRNRLKDFRDDEIGVLMGGMHLVSERVRTPVVAALVGELTAEWLERKKENDDEARELMETQPRVK